MSETYISSSLRYALGDVPAIFLKILQKCVLLLNPERSPISFMLNFVVASSFCCGFGLLILNPYIEATYAQMYLEISGQGKDYSMYNFVNPFGGGFDGGFGSGFGGFGGRFGNM